MTYIFVLPLQIESVMKIVFSSFGTFSLYLDKGRLAHMEVMDSWQYYGIWLFIRIDL